LRSIRFASALGEWTRANSLDDGREILNFLKSVSSITDVDFSCDNFPGSASIFRHLEKRPRLRSLRMMMLEHEIGVPLLNPLFGELQSLSLAAYPEIFSRIIPCMPQLRKLRAYMPSPGVDTGSDLPDRILGMASACRDLSVLELGFGRAGDAPRLFSQEEIWSLNLSGRALISFSEACPRLRRLNIFTFPYAPVEILASGVSDKHFAAMSRALPDLERLCIELHPSSCQDVTWWTLHNLGQNCRRLEVCEISAFLDAHAMVHHSSACLPSGSGFWPLPFWAIPNELLKRIGILHDGHCLFPRLRKLGFAVSHDKDTAEADWLYAMRHDFPCIEQITAWYEDDYGSVFKSEHPHPANFDQFHTVAADDCLLKAEQLNSFHHLCSPLATTMV
jgi:hypothetical protein